MFTYHVHANPNPNPNPYPNPNPNPTPNPKPNPNPCGYPAKQHPSLATSPDPSINRSLQNVNHGQNESVA